MYVCVYIYIYIYMFPFLWAPAAGHPSRRRRPFVVFGAIIVIISLIIFIMAYNRISLLTIWFNYFLLLFRSAEALYIYIYIYIQIHTCISYHIYIYIYIYGLEAGHVAEAHEVDNLFKGNLSLSLYIYIYMYMYTYTYIHIYIYI